MAQLPILAAGVSALALGLAACGSSSSSSSSTAASSSAADIELGIELGRPER